MSTLERLERANPVADADRLLSAPGAMDDFVLAVKERSGIVQNAEDRPPIEVPAETATGPPRREWRRRLVPLLAGAAVVIAAIVVAVTVLNDDGKGDVTNENPVPTTVAASATTLQPAASAIPAVVQEFIDLYSRGSVVAGLDLVATEVADSRRDFDAGLEAWNVGYSPVGTCEETTPDRFACTLRHDNDFHAAAGLSPWDEYLTLTVNDAEQIDSLEFAVDGWQTKIDPFNRAFMSWIRVAHPEESIPVLGVPMGSSFNAEGAAVALQFVDEFVAQSDEYSPSP